MKSEKQRQRERQQKLEQEKENETKSWLALLRDIKNAGMYPKAQALAIIRQVMEVNITLGTATQAQVDTMVKDYSKKWREL